MSFLNKKRERKEPLLITIGKIQGENSLEYYYISDSINTGGNNKIKIALNESSNHEPKNEESTVIKKIIIDQAQDIQPKQNNPQINYMPKLEPVKIPEVAKWFNLDDIHDIEKASMPEFFNGKYPSKTPEIYKKYRNFIINLYRQSPNTYLTATACRRYLSGDVNGIMHLHSFLQKWGLINFKLEPKYKPNNNFVTKTLNYKAPIYIDSSTFLIEKDNNSSSNVIGNNNIIITNKGKELRTLYPINKISENIFRSFLIGNKNISNNNPNIINNQNNIISNVNNINNVNNNINVNGVNKISRINFLIKNYRPKCDLCEKLCSMDWYITKGNDFSHLFDQIKEQENNNNNNNLNNNNLNMNNNESNITNNSNKEESENKNTNANNNSNFIISISNNNSMRLDKEKEKELPKNYKSILVCEDCYNHSEDTFPEGLKKEDFEISSIYNIFIKDKLNTKISAIFEEQKWKEEDTQKLLDAFEKYGDTNTNEINWDDILNYVNNINPNNEINNNENNENNNSNNKNEVIEINKKTKEDCIMHILQLPIKENYSFKVIPEKENQKIYDNIKFTNGQWNNIPGLTDFNNPMTGMIDLFSIFFKKYLEDDYIKEKEREKEYEKDVIIEESKNIKINKIKKKIYEKYKENKNQIELNEENDEKNVQKKIVETLLFTQMKTLELKLNHFNKFDKNLNFKKTQLKLMENQAVQERIKIMIKNEQFKEQIENSEMKVELSEE